MEADIDPAAVAFGPAAADYERSRPGYPAAAIDALRRHARRWRAHLN